MYAPNKICASHDKFVAQPPTAQVHTVAASRVHNILEPRFWISSDVVMVARQLYGTIAARQHRIRNQRGLAHSSGSISYQIPQMGYMHAIHTASPLVKNSSVMTAAWMAIGRLCHFESVVKVRGGFNAPASCAREIAQGV